MSSKSTILLSEDNEHWYQDCSHPEEVTLEIERKNCNIEINDDYIVIDIKRGCHLYNILQRVSLEDERNLPTEDDKKYLRDFGNKYGGLDLELRTKHDN